MTIVGRGISGSGENRKVRLLTIAFVCFQLFWIMYLECQITFKNEGNIWVYQGRCYGRIFVPPPHPYVEILTLNVIVLGGRPWIVIRP